MTRINKVQNMRKILEAFDTNEGERIDHSNLIENDPRDSACQEFINNGGDWDMICMEHNLNLNETTEFCRGNYGVDPYEEIQTEDWEVVDDEFNRQHYPDVVGKVYKDGRDGKVPSFARVKRVEPKKTNEEPEYNKDAVDKEIKKDKRIKGKEGKAIHSLLKGWRGNKKKVTENHEDVIDMHDDGVKPSFIAASLGMELDDVHNIINQGISSRKPNLAQFSKASKAYNTASQLNMNEDDNDSINGELDVEWEGDDGETAHGVLYYSADNVNGHYVVDPDSLTGEVHNDFNRAKVTNDYIESILNDPEFQQVYIDLA